MPAASISVSRMCKEVLQCKGQWIPQNFWLGLTLEKLKRHLPVDHQAAGRQTGPYPKSVWKNRGKEKSVFLIKCWR